MPYPEDNYGSDQDRERLALARSRLWNMLSNGKHVADPHTETEVEYVDIATVVRQNAAKSEMKNLLAGVQSRGAVDTTRDTNDSNTENGVPFIGQNGFITSHGKNYMELLQEQRDRLAAQPSPSPAVNSQGNWSTGDNTVYSASVLPFDADKASDDLIKAHTRKNGTIEKQANDFFLNVDGDGTQASQYADAIPFAVVHPISQQAVYHPDAIDSAFSQANLQQKAKLIRLKKRNKMPLTTDQQYHVRKSSGSDMMEDVE